jgi:hypothetical protein
VARAHHSAPAAQWSRRGTVDGVNTRDLPFPYLRVGVSYHSGHCIVEPGRVRKWSHSRDARCLASFGREARLRAHDRVDQTTALPSSSTGFGGHYRASVGSIGTPDWPSTGPAGGCAMASDWHPLPRAGLRAAELGHHRGAVLCGRRLLSSGFLGRSTSACRWAGGGLAVRAGRRAASSGQVGDRGLWRYTHHPNFFGDAASSCPTAGQVPVVDGWGLAVLDADGECARPAPAPPPARIVGGDHHDVPARPAA